VFISYAIHTFTREKKKHARVEILTTTKEKKHHGANKIEMMMMADVFFNL
jgi:hypothetical protein